MKNPRAFRFVISGCFVLLLSLVMALQAAGSGKAPDWELQDVDGKIVKSSDFKGKVVILDFWATWCPPCRAEIPSFINLQKKYEKQGLVIIGISSDEESSVVKRFMAANKINYPVVMADSKVSEAFGGVEAIPTTFVINPQGQIVSKHVGLTPESTFEKEIKPLLKSASQANPQAPAAK